MFSWVMSAIKQYNWGKGGDTLGTSVSFQDTHTPKSVLIALKIGHCTQSNTAHDIFNPTQMHIRQDARICRSHRLREQSIVLQKGSRVKKEPFKYLKMENL